MFGGRMNSLAAIKGGWTLKITWERRAQGQICGTPVGLREPWSSLMNDASSPCCRWPNYRGAMEGGGHEGPRGGCQHLCLWRSHQANNPLIFSVCRVSLILQSAMFSENCHWAIPVLFTAPKFCKYCHYKMRSYWKGFLLKSSCGS